MADLYFPNNLYIDGKIFIKNNIFQDETQIFPSDIPSLNDLITQAELEIILSDYINLQELEVILQGYVDKIAYDQQMAVIQSQINTLNIGLSNMESSLFNTNQLVSQQNLKIAELEHEIELDQEYLDYLQFQIGNLGFLNTYYKTNLVGAINEVYQIAMNGGGGGLTNVTTDILPEDGESLDIGSAERPWANGYFQNLISDTLTSTAVNTSTINGVPAGNLLTNATINGAILTFSRVDTTTFTLTIPSVDLTAIASNLIPTVTNQYNIGTPTKVWANLYVTGITATSLNGVAISNYLTTSSNPLLTGIWTFNNLPVLGANTVYRPYNTPSIVPSTNITAGTWYCIAKINTQVVRVYSDFTIQFNLNDNLNNRYLGSIRLIAPYSTAYLGQWVDGKIVYNQVGANITSNSVFSAIRTVYDSITDSSYLQVQPNFTGTVGGTLVIENELLFSTPFDVTALPFNTLTNPNYLYAYDIKPYIQQCYTDYAEVTSAVRPTFTQAPNIGFTNLWKPYQAPMYKANFAWDSSKWYSIVKLMTGGVSYINTSFRLRGYTYGSGGTFGQTIDMTFLMPTGGQNYTNYTIYGRIVSCNTKAYMSTREAFGNMRIVQDTTDGNWYLQIQPSGTYSSLIYSMVLEDIYIFTDTAMIEPTVLPATDVLTNITPITTVQKFYTDTIDEYQYFNQIPLTTGAFNLGSITNKWGTLFANKISDANNSTGTAGQYLQATATGFQWSSISLSVDWSNIPSTMTPTTTNAFDIGSSTKKWKDLYVTSIVDSTGVKGTTGQVLQSTGTGILWGSVTSGIDWLNVPSNIVPSAGLTYTLGTVLKPWAIVYTRYLSDSAGSIGALGYILQATGGGIRWVSSSTAIDWINIASNVAPGTTNTYTLGTSTKYWKELYVTKIFDSSSTSGAVGQFLQSTATGIKWATVPTIPSWTDIPSDLIPTTTNTYNLGSSLKKWDSLYINAIYDINNSKGTAGQILQSTATGIQWANISTLVDWLNIPSNTAPGVTNVYTLGTDTKFWANIFTTRITDSTGTTGTAGQFLQSTATGIQWSTFNTSVGWTNVPSNIEPSTTNTFNLGSTTKYWKELYVNKIFDSSQTTGAVGQFLQSTATGIKWATISVSPDYTAISSNLVPTISNNFDIGSSTKIWKDLYVTNIVDSLGNKGTAGQVLKATGTGLEWGTVTATVDWLNVASNILPSVTNTYNLGNSSKKWASISVTNIYDITGTTGTTGQLLQMTATGIKWITASGLDLTSVSTNIVPSISNAYNLGSSSKFWASLCVVKIYDRRNSTGTAGQYLQSTASGIEWTTLPTVDLTAVSTNIVPSTTNSITLGSATKYFSTIYTTNITDSTGATGTAGQFLQSTATGTKWANVSATVDWLNIPSTASPSTTNTFNLGAIDKVWASIFTKTITDTTGATGTEGQYLQTTATGIKWANVTATVDWLNVASNIIPSTNNSFNLGAIGKYWQNLYVTKIFDSSSVSGEVGQFLQSTATGIKWATISVTTDFTNIASNLVPTTTNTYDIGTSTKKWKDLYVTSIIDGLGSKGTTGQVLKATATGIEWGTATYTPDWQNVPSSIIPLATNVYNLGSNTKYWNYLFTKYIVDYTATTGIPGQVLQATSNGVLWTDPTGLVVWGSVPSSIVPKTSTINLGNILNPWQSLYVKNIYDSTSNKGTAGQFLQSTLTGIKWVTLSAIPDLTAITSNLVPSVTNTYDIGTSALKFKDLYVTSIVDSTGSKGTIGQVLQATGTGMTWTDQGSLSALPKMSTGITQKSIWTGTQTEYSAITTPDTNTLYFIYE